MSLETKRPVEQTARKQGSTQWVPQTMLLLGTDASGKNHVASLWTERLREQGCQVEVRESRLCGSLAEQEDHGDKSRLSHLAERGFLLLFPLVKWMIPPAMALLLYWDARRFKPTTKNLLVVSHSPLRILAFTLGQNKSYQKNQALSPWLVKAIETLQKRSKAMVLVLDVDDDTRQQRLRARLEKGQMDPFDRFMAADSQRSEQIEACLVDLTRRHYGAYLIENNDLTDDELWDAFGRACNDHRQKNKA